MNAPLGPTGQGAAKNRKAILTSPEIFLRDLDPVRGRAVFTPMSEASYRASAFLDNRIVRVGDQDRVVDLDDLIELVATQPARHRVIHYLFHIGHCGSTLISRVLGERPCYLALREPPLLMGLSRSFRALDRPGFPISRERWEVLKDLSLFMLGKTWRSDQVALIKATSHAGNLIPTLMRHTGRELAVVLYVDLETFLATMLRPHTRREARLFARDFRARELAGLIDAPPRAADDYSDPELLALTWLLQARELAMALEAPDIGPRCLPLHFDDFLADPPTATDRICAFLGPAIAPAERDRILDGPWLTRAAKDPGQTYGREDRERELSASRSRHAADMAAALAFAKDISDSEALSGLRERFGPARGRPEPS